MQAMTRKPEISAEPTTVPCALCSEEVVLSLRYCGKCGSQTWDPCIACGEKNPIGVRFCGHCGEDQESSIQARREQIQGLILEADDKAKTGRYLDAMALLENLDIAKHSRMSDLAEQIRHRRERFPQQREEAIAQANLTIVEVRSLLERCQYHQAHQRLVAVPPALMTHELRVFLEEARKNVEESDRLRLHVKEKLRERNYEGLRHNVQRLAELNADDEKVEKLLRQLVKRQAREDRKLASQRIHLARTALAECDYKQASQALCAVPEGIEEPKIEKALLDVKERIWMAEMLRTTPHVDATLLAVAKRLVKLQPGDQHAAEMGRRMSQRWAKSQREKYTRPVPWANGLKQTLLDMPVDLLPHPCELANGPGTAQEMGASHGVAFGLALQSLGHAEFALNLAPREKKTSWLKRMVPRGSKRAFDMAWGIDLSSKGLKAIMLAGEETSTGGHRPGTVKILQSVFLPHRAIDTRKGAIEPKGKEKVESAHAETVQRFLDQYNPSGLDLAINIPGTQTLGRFFELPASKSNQFQEAVRYEVRARIPLDEQELLCDHFWTEIDSRERAGTRLRRVTLAAASRQTICERLSLFFQSKSGEPIVLSDCLALANLAWYLRKTAQVCFPGTGSLAVVDIGSTTTNIVMLHELQVWFRGIHWGANNWDQAISIHFQKTQRDAEALRQHPEKSPHMHKLHACLLPGFAELEETLRNTIDQYHHETGNVVSQLFLCGGGSRQFGLLRYLRLGR